MEKCSYCKKDILRGVYYFNLKEPLAICRNCVIRLLIEFDITKKEIVEVKKEMILENLD